MYLRQLKELGNNIWRVDVGEFSYYVKIRKGTSITYKYGYSFGKLDYKERILYLSEENKIINKLVKELQKNNYDLKIKKVVIVR